MTSMVQNHEFADELVKLVREQKRREQRVTGDPDMDFSIYRSGSAPPTIEGSLNSIGGLFSDGSDFVGPGFMSEEEVRADPGYVNYYYSNGNLNPRLPPPLLSKEDWRLAQRNRSFFAVRQGFDGGKEAYGRRSGGDWGGDRLIGLRNGQKTIAEMIQEDLIQTTAGKRFPGGDNLGFLSAGTASLTHASVLGSSFSGKATPDPDTNNGFSASLDESSDLADALCRLNLSKNVSANENRHFSSHSQRQILDHLIPGSLQERSKGVARKMSSLPDCKRTDNFNFSTSNYAFDDFVIGSKLGNGNYSSEYEIAALGGLLAFGSGLMGAETQVQNLSRLRNHAPRTPYVDNLGPNGLLTPSRVAALNEAVPDRRYFGEAYMDFVQKAYLEPLISQQKLQYHSYYTNSGSDFWSSRSPNMSSAFQPRNLSLLDQLKSNKTMNFELSEIAGHIVEFSGDQYGSRFIQQRLETATIEEINIVFNEIMSQAHTLMTDVFGNYVVQKFLEHGTPSQIRQLGDKLMGNVLALSLHMYGCRVIQKALEVVELDQKTQMVKELDGHVMRCVRDQNGNHVIQKCIEHVSEDSIDFIVSAFYDQILTLSTHSYGCRVIQRVLEHCHNEKTQSIVIDEIMRSICMLAQDQYGNYVVQHVLEHGKPQERSAIIEKLTGQIVQMSQHKFASNVIEKCLAFGTPNQRKLLVDEMLGPTDENEHLQAMMKDQFGNYVVQKVLETCNDQQLELVFNRIKVHLNTLQKYTYGKHIVSRVEKLVAAGERRISSLSLDRS